MDEVLNKSDEELLGNIFDYDFIYDEAFQKYYEERSLTFSDLSGIIICFMKHK